MKYLAARLQMAFAVVCLALGAACGQSQPATPKPDLKIAMIAKSSSNPVFVSARTGAEAFAKETYDRTGTRIEIAWLTPPAEDGDVQAQRIAQAVTEGANAVLISCSDAGKVTPAINDAVAHGVPVMTFDSDAPESKRFAFLGIDDVKAGESVLEELAEQIGDAGSIAILAGNQNAPNLQKRVEGVKQAAKKHPKLKIVGTFYHPETPEGNRVISDAVAYVGHLDGRRVAVVHAHASHCVGSGEGQNRRHRRAPRGTRVCQDGARAGPARSEDRRLGPRVRPRHLRQGASEEGCASDRPHGALSRVVRESRHVGSPVETVGIPGCPCGVSDASVVRMPLRALEESRRTSVSAPYTILCEECHRQVSGDA